MENVTTVEDIFIISIACIAMLLPVVIIVMVRVYFIGFDKGVRMAEQNIGRNWRHLNLAALSSEVDGENEDNGEIRRISHGEMVQMETAAKNKTQQNGEKHE